jgi:hypothetical protein
MLMLEGPSRFLLEMIRVEPAVWTARLGPMTAPMSLSMILGLALAAAGVVLWAAMGWKKSSAQSGIFVTAH